MKIASFILMMVSIIALVCGLLVGNAEMMKGGFYSGLIACFWQYARTHENGSN